MAGDQGKDHLAAPAWIDLDLVLVLPTSTGGG